MNDADATFDAYLQELSDPAQPLAVSKLSILSALDPDRAAQFRAIWTAIPESRRRRLATQLIDLAEDNVELNFDTVFMAALRDEAPEIRLAALRGLWEHEGRDMIAPLTDALQHDPDARVRAEAALALGRFALRAELAALPDRDAEAIDDALRGTFRDEAEAVEVRGRALEAVGARSAAWVADLIEEAAESGDRRLRLSALHAMGRSCAERWLPILFGELESDDAEARFEAATACGSIASEEAIGVLAPLLYDEDEEVRQAVIAALGEIGGERSKRALEELLDEADDPLREALVAALAAIDLLEDPLGYRARG